VVPREPPVRILFINQYFNPDLASTGQLLTELAAGLSQRHSVTVVAGFPSYSSGGDRPRKWNLLRTEELDGVRVIRTFTTSFSRGSLLGRLLNYFTFLVSSLLGAVLVSRDTELVVTMTDPPIIALVGYVVSRIRRTRFVFISQDVFPEVAEILGKLNVRPTAWLLDSLNRFLLKRSDMVVAIGETMRKRLIEKGADPESVIVIENWVDTELITPQEKANPFSQKHGLGERFVVMHSGNIGLSQDLDTLVEAANLMRSNDQVEFVIVGDGVSKHRLRERVKNLSLGNVRFLPYQERETLKHSLASADLSVVSLKKGLAGYIVPSKIHGILASGRPVLAAVEDECEVADIVRRENCGTVVEPGNPQQMARAIEALLGRQDLLEEQGRNGRLAAERRYSRRSAVARYANLFEEIHSNGRSFHLAKEED